MQNKAINIVKKLLTLAFWLALWQIIALVVDETYFVPTIKETASAFLEIVKNDGFIRIILLTCARVVGGICLGCALGIFFAVLCSYIKLLRELLSPVITVIRSTPVASFITLLWVLLSGNALSVVIATLMVMPIIWQNMLDGFDSIDKNLSEVLQIYPVSFSRRLKILIFPTLKSYFVPAFITSVGLGWKAEIAAEIVGYVKHSIGGSINDAKDFSNTPKVFAWTIVIITLSIILEKLTKFLLKRIRL